MAITKMTDTEFINYALEREDIGIDWRDLVNPHNALNEQITDIINQIIILPNATQQSIVLLGISCMPSAMSNNAPICLLYGPSGSGKSSIGQLISALYNIITVLL